MNSLPRDLQITVKHVHFRIPAQCGDVSFKRLWQDDVIRIHPEQKFSLRLRDATIACCRAAAVFLHNKPHARHAYGIWLPVRASLACSPLHL
ncbi:MAG: hypothetical protein WCQ21_30725, partial [Verrucomicrobiota bacterium]